jgi:hypothetical protein
MQKPKHLAAAVALAAAALLPTTTLPAQQAAHNVLIDGIRYVPENSAGAATVAAPATVIVAGGGYAAPGAYSQPRATGAYGRGGHIGFGPGVYTLKPKHGDSMDLAGATFGGGWSVAPGDLGSVRLHFDLGLYYRSKSYGESLEYNDWALPLAFSATYEFNLGSPKLRARVGAVLGETVFFESMKYLGNSDSATAAVTSYGGELGFSWTPRDSFHLDLGFRILSNTKAKFKFDSGDYEMESTAQQVTLSLGWRLGRRG